MPARNRPKPLNYGDIRKLGEIARQLAALNAMLSQTSWQGAPAARATVELIYEGIAALYNRNEPYLPEFREPRPPQMPQGSPEAAAAVQHPNLERSAAPEAHEED